MPFKLSLPAAMAVVLAVIIAVGANLTTAVAQEKARDPAAIRVTGEGQASIAPDMAIISLAVVSEAKTAREALDGNNASMASTITAMKEFGIAAKDLQTSGFSIQPRYFYPKNSNGEQRPPQIVGYTVSNQLTVRVRDLARLGEVLDKSVSLGANSGGDIRFTNDDPARAIEQARVEAMKDAMSRAKTLAEAAGVELGPIMEISENFSHSPPVPIVRARAMEMKADASVPIEAGENSYTVTVNAAWEIKQ